MTRPTVFHIHLDRLVSNCQKARQLHGGKIMAVLKANAYGHGDLECARALSKVADGLAVATLEEAVRLRDAGLQGRILLLEGVFEQAEMKEVVGHGLMTVIHHRDQLAFMRALGPLAESLTVWVKVDTGMHRLGFDPDEVGDVVRQLESMGHAGRLTVMTHFAHADQLEGHGLEDPLRRFHSALRGLHVDTSLCNSGAILHHPKAYGDWARPGLMLYGVDPVDTGKGSSAGLEPVMRLTSRVLWIRDLQPGERVGYGGLFRAERPTRVGVVPCGYADGYPRTARQETPVALGGRKAPLIGRVSMDMLTVDLTDIPDAVPGVEVELWGDRVPVCLVADGAGTLAYEVLCHASRAEKKVHPVTG